MIKSFIFLGLLHIKFAAAAAENKTEKSRNNTQNILATALFFTETNDEGRVYLITDVLSKEVDSLIKNDLHNRTHKTYNIKVVPAFKNIHEVPVHTNLWMHLKKKYHNLFTVSLVTLESRKVMQKMAGHIVMYKPKYTNRRLGPEYIDYLNEESRRENKNDDQINNGTIKTSRENFVPNDIYYAIEKRCANWATGCNRNTNILKLPSVYYQVPGRMYNGEPPHLFHGDP